MGDTYYTSFTDAIAAANASTGTGVEIKMLENVTVSDTVSISSKVTLDLNGYEISGNFVAPVFSVKSGGVLTVKDGGTDGTITNSGASANAIENKGGKVTISGGTFNQDVSQIAGVTIDPNYNVVKVGDNYKLVSKYVCQMGDTYYTSFTDAIAAANASTGTGVEIKILKDFTVSDPITISSIVTLDLNGKTITEDYTNNIYVNGGDLIVEDSGKGGTIENKGSYSATIGNVGGTLTINGGIFKCDSSGTTFYNSNGGILTINDATVNVKGVGISNRSGTVTISGGTISSTGNYAIKHSNYDGSSILTITGGTFSGSTGEIIVEKSQVVEGELTVEIIGGTFRHDVSKVKGVTIVNGYAINQNTDGTWTVSEKITDVCQIGDKKYPSIAAAIAAAKTDETITMLKDFTVNSPITINKKITLDLNGKKISGSANSVIFSVVVKNNLKGNLTVTDSTTDKKGQIINANRETIKNSGTLTIQDGTISSNKGSAINNNGNTVEITGGTVSSENAHAINNAGGKVVITDGTVSSEKANAIYNNGGKLEISGGTISSTTSDAIKNVGKITITKTGKQKTYSAKLENDEVTETLEKAIYTKTVEDKEVTFTYDGSYNLQSIAGNDVNYESGDQFQIGRNDYTFALADDEVSVLAIAPNEMENTEDEKRFGGTLFRDVMKNSGNDVVLNAKSDDDDIINTGKNVDIFSKSGNDFVSNDGESSRIFSGFGNDEIKNSGDNVYIFGSTGNDSITNYGENVTINGCVDNDVISNTAANVTIIGGQGEDFISNSGQNVLMNGNSENDTIINSGDNSTVIGETGDDSISNSGRAVIIDGGFGKDIIDNSGESVTLIGGRGHDSISNTADNVSIDAGGGTDTISNTAVNVTINGGGGSDSISNTADSVSIDGGEGFDTISSSGNDVSISGGIGKDLFIYEGGNATITDYSAEDKIQIAKGTISNTSFDGNDVIFNIGKNSLTLKDGAGKKVTITDSSGNTTAQIYSNTMNLMNDNNFVSGNSSLYDITEKKVSVTQIQPTENKEVIQPEISFNGEK